MTAIRRFARSSVRLVILRSCGVAGRVPVVRIANRGGLSVARRISVKSPHIVDVRLDSHTLSIIKYEQARTNSFWDIRQQV